ncbi:unnamed protein product [Notodromas monacha]|uniref:limulus clotting factor C n=1 Tax=Notodromas monacha TaxID=399045 RepID=A0A7R9BKL1_9CRUS|nr:unnamed protein product [Notodromas monacha]CAG0916119.1 unnamed protein product [Notodromas monacha]
MKEGIGPYIVGGFEAERGEYPFMVSLSATAAPNNHFCGGSMIHESWAMTAGHCIAYSTIYVVIREYDTDEPTEQPQMPDEESILVKQQIRHPDYYVTTNGGSENDIALLKLSKSVTWDNFVQPICLPTPDYPTDGVKAVVAGWGRLVYDGISASVLRKVTLPVISNLACRVLMSLNMFGGFNIKDTELCAGWFGFRDSCQGDSGGPLFVKDAGKFTEIGIVSEGFLCAIPLNPGVYTRVSKFVDWIQQTVNNA